MCIYWNHRHVCIGNFSIKITYTWTCMDVVPAENGHQQAKTSRERYIMQFYWILGYVVIRGTSSVLVFAEIVQLPIIEICPFLVGSGPRVLSQSHGRIHSSVLLAKIASFCFLPPRPAHHFAQFKIWCRNLFRFFGVLEKSRLRRSVCFTLKTGKFNIYIPTYVLFF